MDGADKEAKQKYSQAKLAWLSAALGSFALGLAVNFAFASSGSFVWLIIASLASALILGLVQIRRLPRRALLVTICYSLLLVLGLLLLVVAVWLPLRWAAAPAIGGAIVAVSAAFLAPSAVRLWAALFGVAMVSLSAATLPLALRLLVAQPDLEPRLLGFAALVACGSAFCAGLNFVSLGWGYHLRAGLTFAGFLLIITDLATLIAFVVAAGYWVEALPAVIAIAGVTFMLVGRRDEEGRIYLVGFYLFLVGAALGTLALFLTPLSYLAVGPTIFVLGYLGVALDSKRTPAWIVVICLVMVPAGMIVSSITTFRLGLWLAGGLFAGVAATMVTFPIALGLAPVQPIRDLWSRLTRDPESSEDASNAIAPQDRTPE